MDTNTLIDHVKELINRCGIKECDEMGKHIESLKELTRYKDMEDKKANNSSESEKANGGKSEKGKQGNNDDGNNGSGGTNPLLMELKKLYSAIGARIMVFVFVIGSIVFFCCLVSELRTQTVIQPTEHIATQSDANHKGGDTLASQDIKREDGSSDTLLFITISLIVYLIFALCFFFVIKYEYNVWMKDKELSNELKKMYYQRRINKLMKDN